MRHVATLRRVNLYDDSNCEGVEGADILETLDGVGLPGVYSLGGFEAARCIDACECGFPEWKSSSSLWLMMKTANGSESEMKTQLVTAEPKPGP